MGWLAFDTCFSACSAAVTDGVRTSSRYEPMASGQAERLIPMIHDVLDEAGLTVAKLDRIAVTFGPGTFTGTRITIAAARALALATKLPVVAMSSLEMLAQHPEVATSTDGRQLVVAMNVHRGEAYVQRFDGHSRLPLSPPQLLRLDDILALSHSAPLRVVGSAASLIKAIQAQHDIVAEHEDLLPRAGDALAYAAKRSPVTGPLVPLYLRPPDAKPQDGKSLPRVSP
jgi:tRNA threonylcarbamoyladenosine biosynthesis protein TsaB